MFTPQISGNVEGALNKVEALISCSRLKIALTGSQVRKQFHKMYLFIYLWQDFLFILCLSQGFVFYADGTFQMCNPMSQVIANAYNQMELNAVCGA